MKRHLHLLQSLCCTYFFHIGSVLGIVIACVLIRYLQVPSWLLTSIAIVVTVLVCTFMLLLRTKINHPMKILITTFIIIFLFGLRYKDVTTIMHQTSLSKDSLIEGTVLTLNRPKKKKYSSFIRVVKITSSTVHTNHGRPLKHVKGMQVEIVSTFPITHVNKGDVIKVQGNVFETRRLQENSSYKEYLIRKKQLAKVFIYDPNVIERSHHTSRIKTARSKLLLRIEQKLLHYLSPEAMGLSYGIVTGNRQYLPKEVLTAFRNTGTYHVLAVSGMHASIISLLFYNLFRLLRFRRRSSLSLLMFLIFPVYVFITGPRISIIRTYLMLLLGYSLMLLERKVPLLIILHLVFVCVVLLAPSQLYSISFQLSFSAVLGIFMMIHLIQVSPLKNKTLQFLWISISAQAFTTPLAIYNFGYANTFAVLYNLIVPFCISISLTLTLLLLFSPLHIISLLIGNVLSFWNTILIRLLQKSNITFDFFYIPAQGNGLLCLSLFLFEVVLMYLLWAHFRLKKTL